MLTSLQPGIPPIITLTTDFGQQDGYVGAIQGVILTICPSVSLINISHSIPPQDIHAAAFVLYQAFGTYPAHTIHCVVVDPGVGSNRRAVAVRTSHGVFVGPDNGVFSLILTAEPVNVIEAVTLTNANYQLPSVSATFHGRDIFAPAAAHLANGVPLSQFGSQVTNLVSLDFGAKIENPEPPRKIQNQWCRVVHIDRFGNLILSLTRYDIENLEQISFTIKNHVIKALHSTFADVKEGEIVAYPGSTRDHIEIAVRNGNAALELGVQVGDVVEVNTGLSVD